MKPLAVRLKAVLDNNAQLSFAGIVFDRMPLSVPLAKSSTSQGFRVEPGCGRLSFGTHLHIHRIFLVSLHRRDRTLRGARRF